MKDWERLQQRIAAFAQERDWDQFHTPKNLALALSGEVGELCELVQWKSEEEIQASLQDPQWRESLADELSDVLVYLLRLYQCCDLPLEASFERKMQKNAAKYPPEQVRGSAKKYTEYE